jgi:hypothetical protein
MAFRAQIGADAIAEDGVVFKEQQAHRSEGSSWEESQGASLPRAGRGCLQVGVRLAA